MSDFLSLAMFPALIGLIITGFPIAFSMILVATLFGIFLFGDAAAYQLLTKIEDTASNSILAAVPLFIFMGAMLERSGIAERLFTAIHFWTRRLPGGLGVGAVVMGTLFAAASGVVGATEAVIGLLAIPVMLKHNYSKSLMSGTICASGSLGTAIPPSITVVVLGPVASVSVGSLFSGLMVPGFLMAILFLLYIVLVAYLKPEMAPRMPLEEGDDTSWGEKVRVTLLALLPTLALIMTVLGTILLGVATPTEAAACGALGAVVLALAYRTLSWGVLWNSALRTLNISAMILLIVLGGNMFAGVFFAAGGMATVQSLLMDTGMSPWMVIGMILLIAFLAGFVLDMISVVLIVIPVAMPIVRALGFDEIWFCVAFLVVMQTSYLTPPLAPSIFYLRAITPPEVTLRHMYAGVVPFIVVQLIVLALVLVFPSLAMWLPEQLSGPSW
ncbi:MULTISPECIES: TRAP transporter large permease subunit [unclassified Halomonas]|uniref:TRAP transporter large permease n=1 Tax=unclassified Halomonas TaxID=2609666 RepID=UPI002884E03F|nr:MULTISPECIES: TRAP transporter large permease subunit [unclassified Halomonas]MDT0501104.1 TRAP transporter large permease subunit [Halomonas sp. PAR7]MDT0592192.1 TRAP transporter large permease subunit [Halomonas sp. PAR8]